MNKKENLKLFILFFGFMFLASFMTSLGNDYFWHVKAGEYIVNNLKIPYHDVFSWYGITNNLYWISHEWLSEVVIYLFKYIFKEFAPYIYCIVTQGLITFFLYKFNKEKFYNNKLFTIIWSVIGFLTFSRVMLPRPHMISYILLIFTFYLLFDCIKNENSKRIYFLPLISILWASFHGGSSNMPYILSTIFIISGLFNFKISRLESTKYSKKTLIKLLIVTILCILFVNINPHGIKMLTYPYENMKDTYMLETIIEWFPPTLNSLSDFTVWILIIATALILLLSKKKIKLIDLFIMGSFLLLGLKSVKFAPFLYIAATFILPSYITKFDTPLNKQAMTIFLSTIILLTSIIIPLSYSRNQEEIIPQEIIDYIKEKNPERLYNHYNYGGYLIYNDIKVFIDGRADMYSKYNFKDAVDFAKYGYKSILDTYDFDMLIFMDGCMANKTLSEDDRYTLVKYINGVLLYEKKVTT